MNVGTAIVLVGAKRVSGLFATAFVLFAAAECVHWISVWAETRGGE